MGHRDYLQIVGLRTVSVSAYLVPGQPPHLGKYCTCYLPAAYVKLTLLYQSHASCLTADKFLSNTQKQILPLCIMLEYYKSGKISRTLQFNKLNKLRQVVKDFVVHLLVLCMDCADQKSFSLKSPVVQQSLFGNLLLLGKYIHRNPFLVCSKLSTSIDTSHVKKKKKTLLTFPNLETERIRWEPTNPISTFAYTVGRGTTSRTSATSHGLRSRNGSPESQGFACQNHYWGGGAAPDTGLDLIQSFWCDRWVVLITISGVSNISQWGGESPPSRIFFLKSFHFPGIFRNPWKNYYSQVFAASTWY